MFIVRIWNLKFKQSKLILNCEPSEAKRTCLFLKRRKQSILCQDKKGCTLGYNEFDFSLENEEYRPFDGWIEI